MTHLASMWICWLSLSSILCEHAPLIAFGADGQDTVEVETIDGSIRCEIPVIGAESSEISILGTIFPLRDILSIRFRPDEREAQPRDRIILRNHSRWTGKLLLDPQRPTDTVQWITPSLESPLTISLEDLVMFATSIAPAVPFPQPDPDSDQLLTREGAMLSGILEDLHQRGVRFDDPSLGSLEIPWSKVVAFRLVDVPSENPAPLQGTIPIRIRTVDQSQIRAHLVQIDQEAATFSRSTGQQCQISLDRIIDIHFELGRVVALAQREPIAVNEGAPATTWFPWTWKKDRNVLGNPLQIGGITYEHGLGVHSRSLLTYSIEEGDQYLTGIAGMDISSRPPDDQEGIGCAEFRILIDGDERWSAGVLSWKSPASPFRIALEGAKSFTLVVDLGPGHHILDRANWAQIRVIRK
jgi:hypothetical protein